MPSTYLSSQLFYDNALQNSSTKCFKSASQHLAKEKIRNNFPINNLQEIHYLDKLYFPTQRRFIT